MKHLQFLSDVFASITGVVAAQLLFHIQPGWECVIITAGLAVGFGIGAAIIRAQNS